MFRILLSARSHYHLSSTSSRRRSLYHCNYCRKDISNTVRIKCAVCADFDLCLECFSVGVSITPHDPNHAYRVVDNLSFPLYHPAWGVCILLLAFDLSCLGCMKLNLVLTTHACNALPTCHELVTLQGSALRTDEQPRSVRMSCRRICKSLQAQ